MRSNRKKPKPSSDSGDADYTGPGTSQGKRKKISEERGGRDIEDNGFAAWGGYMSAKKQKLDQQFNVATKELRSRRGAKGKDVPKDLFEGVTIHINGFTYPPEPELRELFVKHGGQYTQYPSSTTSFIIATNLAAAKKRLWGGKTLKPEWITDSIKEGIKLDHRDYYLYNLNKENKQQTLTQAFSKFNLKPIKISIERLDLEKLSQSQSSQEARSKEAKQDDDDQEEDSDNDDDQPVSVDSHSVNSEVVQKSIKRNDKGNDAQSESEEEPIVITLSSDDDDNEIMPATPEEPLPKEKKLTPKISTASRKSPEVEKKISSKANDAKSKELDHGKNYNSNEKRPIPPVLPLSPSEESEFPKKHFAFDAFPTEDNDNALEVLDKLQESEPSKLGTLASEKRADDNTLQIAKTSTFGMKTAAQEGFLQEFYSNSRLHLISTLKKERQQDVLAWRRNTAARKFPLLDKYSEILRNEKQTPSSEVDLDFDNLQEQVLFHVDLDCFFVAVARLSRPELLDKPMVITHSKGNAESKSDIACASYEARDKGISAGMWVGDAKELCPDLVVIPYEFDEYSRVSKFFYETVARLTLEMEAISCDEMLVNVSQLVKQGVGGIRADPIHLAKFLIKEIYIFTGIRASVGIGVNRLVAKIATREAKDRKLGCYFMTLSDARKHIRKQPASKLPGVGWAIGEKLDTLFNVKTGADMEKLSEEELKRQFGEKNGQKLYLICRGVDSDVIKADAGQGKTLSAGCSFGVRFSNNAEFEKFVRDVADEVTKRATDAKCFCRKIILQLWIAKKGHEVSVKPGGHGVSYAQSKGMTLLQKTRDPNIIGATALELARQITLTSVPPESIRGVMISLEQLVYEADLSEKERRTKQTTLFEQLKMHSSKKVDQQAQSTSRSTLPATAAILEVDQVDLQRDNAKPSSSSSAASRGNSSSSNPYADVKELDPDYLAALPEEVRAEVLLEFQKAKHMEPSITGASSSKSILLSPKKFVKRSPIRKKSKSPLKNSKTFQPGKQTVFSPANGLYRYYKAVSQAKKPSPEKKPSSTEVVNPIKRGRGKAKGEPEKEDYKNMIRKLVREGVVEESEKSKHKKVDSQKIITVTEEKCVESGSAEVENSCIEMGENRLTPEEGDNEFSPATFPDNPEIDKEFQKLLETPQKKDCFEIEKMVLSFRLENEKSSNSNSCDSYPQPEAISKSSSADIECGQPLIKPNAKKKLALPVKSPVAGSSKNSASTTETGNRETAPEDIEIQEAILQSYNNTNGNGLCEENEGGFEDDRMSLANNVDSDREDDFFDGDTLSEEIELPPLNGVTEIDKVHEMIRRGITDRAPVEDDIESLRTYFHDLSSKFLSQACNSLRFLHALQTELNKKCGIGSKEWIQVFDKIIDETRQHIQEEFGGVLDQY